MKINKIYPQGFCYGVKNALKILDEAINDPSTLKPIYLLGHIIHNKHIVDEIKDKGVIVIEDKNKSRLELLDSIISGTVVFSAHGVSPLVYEKAKEKKLRIIDTTCSNVKIVKDRITKYLALDYKCLYIGSKGHPECEAILSISNQIDLISSIDDVKYEGYNNLYVTNQTTLSIFDVKDIYTKLKELNPSIIIDDKICNATTIRQQALANQSKADMCIIVGDKSSSNTKKLYSVSKNISLTNTILVEDLDDLKNYNLSNINTVSISSGASTPDYLVNSIIEYLEKK